MAATLFHRGPDATGVWLDATQGIALGFQRLSILELSPLGHQPMTSSNGRFTIVFNGEIYNYRSLRAELRELGHSFRGSSDTEVLLASISHWGVRAALERVSGMFAFALWDGAERQLTLARDRVGKKPVYYGKVGDAWVYGSELKALRAYPGFPGDIDRVALRQYFKYGYVPAPRAIYNDVKKLLPGHFITLSLDRPATAVCYWDARQVVTRGRQDPLRLSDAEHVDALDELLRDAVACRMIADVPVGAFLSGGLDSSLVVSLMQAQSNVRVRTFTIGFDIPGYNEATTAKAVAAHLGTEHTELYLTSEQTRDVIPHLPSVFDEPFADSSQIPTYLVSRLARSDVVVSLSGDGGDELFGGYNRYFWAPRIWRLIHRFPVGLRRRIRALIEEAPPARVDWIYNVAQPVLPSAWAVQLSGDRLHKLARLLDAGSEQALYASLVSIWQDPSVLMNMDASHDDASPAWEPSQGFVESMMYQDLVTYLPDDILTKVDRASMGVSLEVRAPLLDHRVIEWAWRLPLRQRIRDNESKWLVRQLLYRYVPKVLVDRPKMGFGVPIDSWLRGPLREWAEDLLSEKALRESGLLVAAPVRRVWMDHLEGRRNEQARIWTLLMFQSWHRHWVN